MAGTVADTGNQPEIRYVPPAPLSPLVGSGVEVVGSSAKTIRSAMMKVFRKNPDFVPIHIVIENESDAENIISLIDKVSNYSQLTKIERDILKHLSGAFVNFFPDCILNDLI
jgi:hypothetical protein